MKKILLSLSLFLLTIFPVYTSNAQSLEDRSYTLIRNSVLSPQARIHFATFDADERVDFNKTNCEQTAQLILSLPNIKAKYWCEKGFFKNKVAVK